MNQKSLSTEKGQSLVELAVSFTFLLILFGGITDLGMMFYTYLSLRDTAQEGAMYGSYDPLQLKGTVNSRIQNSSGWPIDSSKITDITVTCNGASCSSLNVNSCPGQKITVQVIYSYKPILPMLSAITSGQPISLNASVTDTILSSEKTISDLKALPTPVNCPTTMYP